MPNRRRQLSPAGTPVQTTPRANNSHSTPNTVVQVKDNELEKQKLIKDALKSLPLFKGSGDDQVNVRHHFALLESRSKIYKWTKDDLCTIARLSLAADALEYLVSVEDGSTFTYEQIKDSLCSRFNRTPEIAVLKARLDNIKKTNKTVRQYADEIQSIATKLHTISGYKVNNDALFSIFERGLKNEDKKTLTLLGITTFEEAINKLSSLEAFAEKSEINLHGSDKNHVAPKINHAFVVDNCSEELNKQSKVEHEKLTKEVQDLKEMVAQLASSLEKEKNKNKNSSNNFNSSNGNRRPRFNNNNNFVCYRCQRIGHTSARCRAVTNVYGHPLRSPPDFQPMFGHLQMPAPALPAVEPQPIGAPGNADQLALPPPPTQSSD